MIQPPMEVARAALMDARPSNTPSSSVSEASTGLLALGAPATTHRRWLTLALFIGLAIVHTWPLALAPGTYSRNDTSDTVLHEWTIAWVAHQIVRDPLHLFDANIFYPDRYTLAYSDHLILHGVAAAPLLWAGASPVLAYNLLLIAGLALTGWATSSVLQRWTGSWLAGILGGSLAAFNAFTLTRLPQIQDQHLEFFPLALLALDRLLASPGLRHALQLSGWFVLQGLTAGYLLAFTSISLVASVAVRPREWTGQRLRVLLPYALLAGALAIVALSPFLFPYFVVSRTQSLTRPLDEVAQFSAHFTDYLATGGRLHYVWWSGPLFKGYGLFPGVIALGLAGFALVKGVAFRDRRARMALAFGAVAFALSFGPAFPLYEPLYQGFPLMSGVRSAGRFGQFALFAVAILAGMGLATLQRQLRRWALPLCTTLVVAVHVEALRAPINYSEWQGIPPVYRNLRAAPRGVIAFFPFYSPELAFLNARYMLVSTEFWTPMLNGYSGFVPPSYTRHAAALTNFPDDPSIEYLKANGVTHVLVEAHRMRGAPLARLPNFPQLRLWLTDGNLRIYELTR
jgi:hypothetical protein